MLGFVSEDPRPSYFRLEEHLAHTHSAMRSVQRTHTPLPFALQPQGKALPMTLGPQQHCARHTPYRRSNQAHTGQSNTNLQLFISSCKVHRKSINVTRHRRPCYIQMRIRVQQHLTHSPCKRNLATTRSSQSSHNSKPLEAHTSP